MDINEELDQQIDRYIKNQMTTEELSTFEKIIASDTDLADDISAIEFANSYYNKDLIALVKTIDEVEKKHFENQTASQASKFLPKKNHTIWKKPILWLSVAASLALFIALYFLYAPKNELDFKQLVLADAEKGFVRSEINNNLDSLLATNHYGLYIQNASTILKTEADSTKRIAIDLNILVSYINLLQFNEAISFYKALPKPEQQNCDIKYQAALCYLALKEIGSAKILFQEVINAACFPNDENARKWLKKMNK